MGPKRKSWWRFIFGSVLIGLLMWAAGAVFSHYYRIGIDPQKEKCLPYTLYLIDLQDRALERGALYAFKARGLEPLYKDGTQMVKILTALPGDTVEINTQHEIRVNGQPVAEGLPLAKQLHLPESHFYGKSVLEDGYWFMGKNPLSFDSRYWGVVKDEQVIGRAYPLI